MNAWFCESLHGVDALTWRELPTPKPTQGQILVRIQATSLNFADLLIMRGEYQFKPELPFIPGSEYAGIIEAVGDGVQGLSIGQSVACFTITGGFATHALAMAHKCILLPMGFPLMIGAAFTVSYATSYHALVDRGQLRMGETVLVLGAAGGVGMSAIQVAKVMGAKVIAAVSTEEKCAFCLQLGADAAINYVKQDLRQRLNELTDGKGPDVIYDPVGGSLAELAFRSIAWRGRYLVIGFTAGEIPAISTNLILLKGANIIGVFTDRFMQCESGNYQIMMRKLFEWYMHGKINLVIDDEIPMIDLKSACARMNSQQVKGKLLLINS